MWTKLESLYMAKSLPHKQSRRQQLYSYRMMESKTITEQLTKFNKNVDDL